MNEYFYKIYSKNHRPCNLHELDFLYACAPSVLTEAFPMVRAPDDMTPPCYNERWAPGWFPQGCYAINKYPPTHWWDYKYSEGFADNTWIEVLHVPDDNPVYTVWAFWVYEAAGSGVFMNLGKTLRARNKIHALLLLGLNIESIASLLWDKYFQINENIDPIQIGAWAKKHFPESPHPVKDLLWLVLNYPNAPYWADRINTTAHCDGLIVMLANRQGYDSVQFAVQANGFGGWGFEVVFTGMDEKDLFKPVEKDWNGWDYILARTTATNIHTPCTFNSAKQWPYAMLTCKEQHLTDDCTASSPPVPPYT